ncbi:hypothetical protein ACFLZB_04835 [Nanoarchaeota archaeon]
MNKRGQVTIFIIIGIIIVVALVLFFALRSSLVEQQLEVARPVVEQIPTEFEPIRIFTEDCIKVTAEDGLTRLGQQGGYIYPVLWDNLNFNEINPTDSDGVVMGSAKVPYYWFNKAQNNQNVILLSSNMPTKEDMQNDLALFIENELAACLDSYNNFVDLGFEFEEGTFDAQVSIVPGSVRVAVTHPLTINRGASQSSFGNFYTEVPVDLNQMYEVANQIVDAEKEFTFVESGIVGLIEVFSETEPDLLPPMTAQTFETVSTVSWSEQQVKQDITDLLTAYTPLFRYLSSSNYYSYQYPEGEISDLQQRVYDNMILPLDGAENLEVRFQYLDLWDIHFDTNAEGDIIQPNSVTVDFFINRFGWQNFRTNYDISYPVFISLHSPEAMENKGFQFNFALEANIRNNHAVQQDEALDDLSSNFQESMLCNENQKNSGEITVRVYDAYDLTPIPDAAVTYSAGQTCSVGLTGEDGVLISKFPIAIGGSVSAAKAGYLTHYEILDTSLGREDSIDVLMWRVKTIDAAVVKKKVYNCKNNICYAGAFQGSSDILDPFSAGTTELQSVLVDTINVPASDKADESKWYFSNLPLDLAPGEQAIVMLDRQSFAEDEFSSGSTFLGTQTNSLSLVPGIYDVTISIISSEELVIPEEERCEGVLGFEECADTPRMEFPQFQSGGARWTGSTLLEISPYELYESNSINFVSLSIGLLDIPESQRVAEDTLTMARFEQYTNQLTNQLEPIYT